MDNIEECVREFKAFARGGKCGVERLRKVYPSIMKEFRVSTDKLDLVLFKSGLRLHRGKVRPLTS